MKRIFNSDRSSVLRSQTSNAIRQFGNSSGAALIIILNFIVIFTVMVLAYFSFVTLQRQISQASFNHTAVEIFAQGAVHTITADLKQEIIAGSTNLSTNTATYSLYFPLSPSNAVPSLAGSSGNNGLENLIKRSSSTDAFYSGGSTRAAPLSTTNLSQNSRYISPARWNAALLLPKANTNSATDFTPTNTFTSPDWVLVARDGTNPNSWNANMRWSSSNSTTVVGRYAYTVYDEGGLLDVNAAGYPPGSPTNFTTFKGSLAYADLTMLPGMTTNAVSALVGWRNYASAQPSGSFPAFLFNSAAQTNYFNSVRANASGFLRPANTNTAPDGQTDRLFVSRQQLIQFLSQAADPGNSASVQNALRYLGTFTRSLEQPSYRPDANRPKIVSPTLPAPPAPDNLLTYRGNNDAAGLDDEINPSFLGIRVAGTFNRNDSSIAKISEPLVKHRFSIKRLVWMTYKGPSALRGAGSSSMTDPDYDMWALVNTHGISSSFLKQGTAENIQKYFGLTWDNTNRVWVYNHGSPGGHVIGRLSDLVSIREPDFAELLKASINAGSLGKAAEVTNVQQYQYNMDRSLDYQVLQIMANVIDQSDLDSYPTRIQFSYGTTTKTVAGAEDLPYAYRNRLFVLCTRQPVPLLSNTNNITFTNVPSATSGDTSTANVNVTHIIPTVTASGTTMITDPGEATALRIPDVWNPYDANCATATSKAIRPTNFRILLLSYNAGDVALNWQVSTTLGFWNTTTPNPSPYKAPAIPAAVTSNSTNILLESNSALEFQDNAGNLFREPTLLWRPGIPTGSYLKMSFGNALGSPVNDVNNPNNKSYLGFLVGKSPILITSTFTYNTTDSTKKSTNGSYIFQGYSLAEKTLGSPGVSGANPGYYTFRVQYEYPSGSGNWFTYDEKYLGNEGAGSQIFCVNTADYINNNYLNPYVLRSLGGPACAYDPRTPRFGMGTEVDWTTGVINNGPAFEVQLLTTTPANNANVGASDFTVLMTNRAGIDRGQSVSFQVPGWQTQAAQMRWFSGLGYYSKYNGNYTSSPLFYDGLLSQNNPAVSILSRGSNTSGAGAVSATFYYEDPDGICRRAMGAYANTTLTGNNTTGLPLATANTIAAGGVPTPMASGQSQSRPFILNRPFKNVGELSYTFRGTPWKNIDFFTSESGDAALLDVFCLDEPPANGITAGKVSLNTRNAPVLQALINGAYIDEMNQITSSPPSYAVSPTASGVALNVANKLISITTDKTNAWRGPLRNVSELVGRYISNPGSTSGASDQYTFQETVTGTSYTYAGLSAALDSTVLSNSTAPLIQRFREAPIRALAACGQTRVWNLMIDVIAQTGRYPQNANSLEKFVVEGEKRYWVHVAIDRLTGEIIDKQIETVIE